jgi:hypothetical protein
VQADLALEPAVQAVLLQPTAKPLPLAVVQKPTF